MRVSKAKVLLRCGLASGAIAISQPAFAASAPACVYDASGSSAVPNAAVPTRAFTLSRDGVFDTDYYDTDAILNSFEGEVLATDNLYGSNPNPVELIVTKPNTQFHVTRDVGIAGGDATALRLAGWCNLTISTSPDLQGRSQLSLDTFDTSRFFSLEAITNQNPILVKDRQDYLTPHNNKNRELRLASLSLKDIDLVIDDMSLTFYDPKLAGQGEFAQITLSNASIDARNARGFQTSLRGGVGGPHPTKIISTGGPSVVNTIMNLSNGGTWGWPGRVFVDVLNGSTFEFFDTGSVTIGEARIGADFNNFGTLTPADWTINVSPDGNGGTFQLRESNIRMKGNVNLGQSGHISLVNESILYLNGSIFVTHGNASINIGRNSQLKISDDIIVKSGILDFNFASSKLDVKSIVLEDQAVGLNFLGPATATIANLTLFSPAGSELNFTDTADAGKTIRIIELGFFKGENKINLSNGALDIGSVLISGTQNPVINLYGRNGVAGTATAFVYIDNPILVNNGNKQLVVTAKDLGGGTRTFGNALILSGNQDLARYKISAENDTLFDIIYRGKENTALYSSKDVVIVGKNTRLRAETGSVVRPGDFCADLLCEKTDPGLGKISVEGEIFFDFFTSIDFDIGKDALGNVVSDGLFYGLSENSFRNVNAFNVNLMSNVTASDLDRHTFTLIGKLPSARTPERQNSASSRLMAPANLPALVNMFVVEDLSDNGELIIGFERDGSLLSKKSDSRNDKGFFQAVGTSVSPGPVAGPKLINGTPLLTAIDLLTNAQLEQGQGIFHAEAFASHLTNGLEAQYLTSNVVMNHASGAGVFSGKGLERLGDREASAPLRHRAWIDFGFRRGSVTAKGDLGDFGYDLDKLIAGYDVLRGSRFIGGVFANYGSHRLSEHDIVNHRLDTESAGFGVYGQYIAPSGFRVTTVGGVDFGTTKSRRVLPDMGLFTGGTATSRLKTFGAHGSVRLHVDLLSDSSSWSFIPSIETAAMHISTNEAREVGGGDFNFAVRKTNAQSIVLTPGLDLTKSFTLTDAKRASLNMRIRYEHDVLASDNSTHTITVDSPLFGSFSQIGQNRGANAFVGGLHGRIEMARNVFFGAGYQFARRSQDDSHEANFNLTAVW